MVKIYTAQFPAPRDAANAIEAEIAEEIRVSGGDLYVAQATTVVHPLHDFVGTITFLLITTVVFSVREVLVGEGYV